ncbi:DUF2489 domain-containing protein [Uliginosibacterium sediminicola]|uniref:DUF2489 domain-containing protein n=1 Tax=Uliginosibacterium sediminicola TaxID=2024550 RepID=A0ABU9Z3M7_9RHOO
MASIAHESYVQSVRNRVYVVALGMLDGSIPFLEGAITLASLRHEAAVEDSDEDFLAFVAIASETDDLPIGQSRKHWSVEALEKHQPLIEKATQWAKEVGTAPCQSLVSRFNNKNTFG